MKKKIIVAILALCVFVLSGCGSADILKLTETTLSASNFYHELVKEGNNIMNIGASEIYFNHGNDQTYQTFGNLLAKTMYGQDVLATVVSMMDFATFIVESETAVAETTRIYEYDLSDEDSGCIVVVVSKVKNKQVYNCTTYLLDSSPNNFANVFNKDGDSTNSFLVTVDNDKGVYLFSDSDNGVNGTFYYNKYEGKMSVVVDSSIYYDGVAIGMYSVNYNLYNYKNAVAGRVLVTYSSGDVQEKYIQEFYAKDFYKKAKFGMVKDGRLYEDMEKITQAQVAKNNTGDNNGFTVLCDTRGDESIIRVMQY